ncbi:MAG: helix-turn-helix transcriptional regulator [Coprococcus sp.]
MNEWYERYNGYFRIPDRPLESVRILESRYQLENELLRAVGMGNESRALKLLAIFQEQPLPPRLNDELRNYQNYSITMNTLLRKAAEHARVHPLHIDCLSNQNIRRIEELTDIHQCLDFQHQMVRDYCSLIRHHNLKDYSILTQKIITCVNSDLQADLTLKSLAEQLSVNASYLSTLFKKETGMPLTEYVNGCRIEHAQKLLLVTDLPIKEIAHQCGMADVYYFNRLFKRLTGTTPKKYRKAGIYN